MVIAGPTPGGSIATVILDDIAIQCLPGKYAVVEADRFGQKISTGDVRYQDFNPYESAEAMTNGLGGAGVLRMSDVEHTVNLAQPYKEASGVNAAGVPIILAPLQVGETLPSSNGPPVWAGEFNLAGVRKLVCVAGTKVFTRNASGSGAWIDTGITLAAVPLRGAVGVFAGALVFGYGAAHTAQATTDLTSPHDVTQTAGTSPIYVFAFTSDHAAAYVAGGAAVTQGNQVLSSVNGDTAYAGAVPTGDRDSVITSLAPGGGAAILFVGKDRELGQINAGGTYDTLIPFDSRLSSNCLPLKWWMGSGDDSQRGPLVLVFPRERSLWEYAPGAGQTTVSFASAATAANISPWANPVRRPPNSRGLVTAIQGTARWLYFTVTSASGHSWVWRRDSWTGPSGENAPHNYLDLGVGVSQMLAVSSVTSVTGNPMLYVGLGNNLVSVILPLDGEDELSDINCRFTSTGYIDLSDIDLGLPDEDKISFTVRLLTKGLVAGGQTIDVQFGLEGGALQDIGTAISSPAVLTFPGGTVGKFISPRVILATSDPSKTPELWAIVFRESLNTVLYQLVEFQGTLNVGGSFFSGADNTANPEDSLNQLWADRRAGFPVPFQDRWLNNYTARILSMSEKQVVSKVNETPETVVDITLLLVSGPLAVSGGITLYDTPTALYDVPTSVYG